MRIQSVFVRGVPILGLLLVLLFIRSKPTILHGDINKMLPNQIGPRITQQQDRIKDGDAILSGNGQPTISKEINQVLVNRMPPNKDGRQDMIKDGNAASSANGQSIIVEEEDKALPNQNPPRKDVRQEKGTDDNAASNANEQPITKEKGKALPNQSLPNKDESHKDETRMEVKSINDNAASSANVQPVVSKEKDTVLPNQKPPNNDGGQENVLIPKEKDEVLPNQNPPQKDGRRNIVSGENAASGSGPTASEKTGAHIFNRRPIYEVGDELLIKIVARDAFSRPKTTGGDYFTTQLFSTSPIQASTAGKITDYGNGTYIARFVLGWPGLVTAQVRLIHSSEAVNILKKSRSHKIRRFYSCSFFDATSNNTEWTSCTFNQNEKADYSRNICDFSEPVINVTWYCHKPKNAPCEAPIECRQDRNKSLGVEDVFTKEEKAFLEGDRVEVQANISVIVKERDKGTERKVLLKCGPRLPEPASEGYWYNALRHMVFAPLPSSAWVRPRISHSLSS
ncbi:uncharacterized protein [Branchiostoma lanceolatum]|uniref:uncharacterized protein n=1 Tax=Branchiostoma lanceolatum TaxID=7740 RepID=UPI003454BE5A